MFNMVNSPLLIPVIFLSEIDMGRIDRQLTFYLFFLLSFFPIIPLSPAINAAPAIPA